MGMPGLLGSLRGGGEGVSVGCCDGLGGDVKDDSYHLLWS